MKVYLKDILDKFPEFEVRNYDDQAYFTGFSHDSRSVKEGEIYIPIVGEKFDGHNFIADALSSGASMAICENSKYGDIEHENKPVILVDSIEEGLEKILNLSISDITSPIVAITGSTGKTTTRQMLVEILEGEKKVLSSNKTNTVWGNAVLLSDYDDHEVVVLECGMDRPNEIAWHVNAVDPDLGILLNVGHVHSENVGSIEDVYREKKDLADYMERTGKPLVLNIDDERLVRIKENYREGAEIVTFGKREDSDFQIVDVKVDKLGTHFAFKYYDNTVDVHLSALGEGHVYNAMAAIIGANLLGVSIDNCIKRISSYESSNGRFEKLEYGSNITIINDAYNANPASMGMSLKTLDKVYPSSDYYRIAVLGDMNELGDVAHQKHRELGELVEGYGFDSLYYVGQHYEDFGKGEHLDSADEVAATLNIKLESLKNKKVVILLKASNSLGLYQVPDFLRKLGAI